mmetsp:Transcript_18172/g.41762  ORF Transcript_18172/g.41762 Transcript_18172/m.41762 type:complete len:471 (+) Transcript_18172:294-1706(+)
MGKKSKMSAEDALEKKMKSKRKQAKKAKSMENALEAKIRKKKAAEAEEEKMEESVGFTSGQDDEEYGRKIKAKEAEAGGSHLFTSGGGDVRNRPRQQLQQNQPAVDPLRAAQQERDANKKEMNSRFQDLHSTGQWGALGKVEKYCICLLGLGAIGAAIYFGLRFSGGGAGKTPSPTQQPTKSPTASPSAAPSMEPTGPSYRAEYAFELMTAASPKLTLPQTPDELVGASNDPSSTPQELAAEFILYDDELEIQARDPRFMERYALSVFYYQNGGCELSWFTSTNWGSGEHCNWHGVVCNLQNRVVEINLGSNNVSGKLPVEFSQLLELGTMDLSNNRLSGRVSSESLSMPKMFTIQLNSNLLTGEFPFIEIKSEGAILDTLWIQENIQLSGSIPESYCTMGSVTLDCDNFKPQPTFLDDGSSTTTFQAQCLEEVGAQPREFTCNDETSSPVSVPVPSPSDRICGVPAAGT